MANKFVRSTREVKDVNKLSDNVGDENDIFSQTDGKVFIKTRDGGYKELGGGVSNEELEPIKSDVTTLKSENNKLKNRVSDLETANEEKTTKISELETKSTDLETDVTTLKSENNDLKNKVTELETKSEDFETRIKALENPPTTE